MKQKRLTAAQRRRQAREPDFSPAGVGLAPERYAAALRYLFDRPVPLAHEQEWYWGLDEPDFDASPIEWTRIQTVLFAQAGTDLAAYSDEQVGMGLNYLMNNAVSNVPFAAIDPAVPIDEALRMMQAMPALWRQCIGPRLAHLRVPIGASAGRLAFVCYMWFDVWPTFWQVRQESRWRDALWQVLREMLDVPCREVQVAALHGIGHNARYLERQDEIDRVLRAFGLGLAPDDTELKTYAEAARRGCVQ